MPQSVDTARSAEHRKLRFSSLDELRAEVDRIVAADQAGTLRRTGNWSTVQLLGHLAAWINFGWDGYPMKVPWFVRWIVRLSKAKYLRDGMPRGVRIPSAEAGTYGTEELSTHEGADRLRKALDRLKRGEPPKFESPAFGVMPHEERIALNLRHAELHLGYLHP
jgi:hypothetical protein